MFQSDMTLFDWSILTPEDVTNVMTFIENDATWQYDIKNKTSMASKQAEGVAYLCRLLEQQSLAILADEVGMGKTFQALGVVKLLQQQKPDAKILIMAPNQNICRQWIGEVTNFEQNHWKANLIQSENKDNLISDGPFSRLEDLVKKLNSDLVDQNKTNLYFTTIHALSGLLHESDHAENKLSIVADKAHGLKEQALKYLGAGGFDLLIIDEAHYLRTRHGGSQKVAAASAFFGQDSVPLASKVLLMTATPTHSSTKDVENILRYFTSEEALQCNQQPKDPSQLLEQYGLRRLRLLQGRDEQYYAKQNYRQEVALPVSFEANPEAELFFGLYQRHLVRDLRKRGANKQFLYGYLEGFESFGEQHSNQQAQSTESNRYDYINAPDSKLLHLLSQEYYDTFNEYPQHPKYQALVDEFVPPHISAESLNDNKHLVFVRRIPSVQELTKRVNRQYDDLFGELIANALSMKKQEINHWKKNGWSRTWLNKWWKKNGHTHAEEDGLEVDENQVEDSDNTAQLTSRITELFVVKRKGTGSLRETRNTICTNVSLRFRKPESAFSLYLEPALDYKSMDYEYYLEQQSGDKIRPIYSSAAQVARINKHHQLDNSKPIRGEQMDENIPTIWKHLLEYLEPEHNQILDSWNIKIKENFANYFKAGVLFASPVMIELFAWFITFDKNKRFNPSGNSALNRYVDFVSFSSKKIKDSMLLWYFKASIITFEDVCNKIARIDLENFEHDWRQLKSQSSPAAYASGDSSNRENLQLGFNSPFYPNVLVATSVFQEGVNLHLQCNNVHHYGLARSPGDHEQRVGRLDRLFSKVNRQLKSNGEGKLRINFPYLQSSFDEDQLASFLAKKALAESKLDKCLLNTSDSTIGTEKAQNWTEYLKQPEENKNSNYTIEDPYPARFE